MPCGGAGKGLRDLRGGMQRNPAHAEQPTTAPGGNGWRSWGKADLVVVAVILACGLALSTFTISAIPSNSLNGEKVFPLDDAYIHFTFARSVAAEGRMAFRPGDVVPAVTGPLWTYLLGLGALVFSRLDWLALGLGAAGYLLSAILMYGIGVRVLRSRFWGAVRGLLHPC